MDTTDIRISPLLAHNIRLIRTDETALLIDKAKIADALYGIDVATSWIDGNEAVIKRLNTAKEVIFEHLFYLDMIKTV